MEPQTPIETSRTSSGSKKRSLFRGWGLFFLQYFGPVIIGGIFVIVAGVINNPRILEDLGYRKSEIEFERVILYAQILNFRDKKSNEGKPLFKKQVGLNETSVRKFIDIYDEALYIKAYYIKKHKVSEIELHATSSGITGINPILPNSYIFDQTAKEQYEKTKGKILNFKFNLKKGDSFIDYLLYKIYYFNAYQYNPTKKKYESDGGIHLDHHTDELIIIFDFSNLDYKNIFNSEPKIIQIKGQSHIPKPAIYDKGIIVSEPILDIPKGSVFHCDWEWKIETSKNKPS